MYYTVIKHDGDLRTRGKCWKHEPQANFFCISRVLSKVRSVLSQCNTRLWLFHLLRTVSMKINIPLKLTRFSQFCVNRPRSLYHTSEAFGSKLQFFKVFFCLSIYKRDWDRMKTTPNIAVCPESLGALLECWYIERGLFNCVQDNEIQSLLRYC